MGAGTDVGDSSVGTRWEGSPGGCLGDGGGGAAQWAATTARIERVQHQTGAPHAGGGSGKASLHQMETSMAAAGKRTRRGGFVNRQAGCREGCAAQACSLPACGLPRRSPASALPQQPVGTPPSLPPTHLPGPGSAAAPPPPPRRRRRMRRWLRCRSSPLPGPPWGAAARPAPQPPPAPCCQSTTGWGSRPPPTARRHPAQGPWA